jgi:hypothetical protein
VLAASGGDAFRSALLGRVGAQAHQRFADELLDYVLEDYPGRQARAPCAVRTVCAADALERRQGHTHLIQWLYCLYADDLAQQSTRKRKAYDEALLAAARGVLRKLSGARRSCTHVWRPSD